MHVDFIYAQKDSFAHRYGILEICGAFAVGFRLIRPGRPLPARSLPPARGGRLLRLRSAGMLAWSMALLVLARWFWRCWLWSAEAGLLADGAAGFVPRGMAAAFVCSRGDDYFLSPRIAWRPGR